MKRDWWERAIASMADAGTLFGMPPASVELMILEQREREEAERRGASLSETPSRGIHDDDDDGDGGSRCRREPVAA
jgi:hypothetical protein